MKILDYGSVELIDTMGDDNRILDAARHSTGSDKNSPKENRQLIRYLLRNNHTSPFEFGELCFNVKLPIFVARQWIRHRTANVNEISGRYSVIDTEFYLPELDRIKGKGKFNKQGSEGELDLDIKHEFINSLKFSNKSTNAEYNYYNSELGISNELARIDLPLSTYTSMFWKIDLHNFLHFSRLRMSNHAQYEIRVYAQAMYDMVKEKFPLTCEAFEDYKLNGVEFSATEMKLIKSIINSEMLNDLVLFNNFEEIDMTEGEYKTFINKLL